MAYITNSGVWEFARFDVLYLVLPLGLMVFLEMLHPFLDSLDGRGRQPVLLIY